MNMDHLALVEKIMAEFAESTGLSDPEKVPRRYLWTDAFALCNFLELYRRTADHRWNRLALQLVDQVHFVLGHHRPDDPRSGWISGLAEEEGRKHPTRGGLRIGKSMSERKPSDPFDERLEWERDGQYYHYLTKWMHGLNRASRSTGNPIYNSWAIELAKAAHAGFVSTSPSKRMYWKMSIDLSFPLVPSMGQHDPLDGLVTYFELEATAAEISGGIRPSLGPEISELSSLCEGRDWATDDPLGIGGLLFDSYRVLQLISRYGLEEVPLFSNLLNASLVGLEAFSKGRSLSFPAEYRLAFRELGLSIGLHAARRIRKRIDEIQDVFGGHPPLRPLAEELGRYATLGERIEEFWLKPLNREAPTWTGHGDINSVMLATTLAPDGFLEI
jgi:hypothetical protein